MRIRLNTARVPEPELVTEAAVPAELEKAMQVEKILPDLLTLLPKETLQVSYLPGTFVHLGNELDPAKVRSAPRHISWTIQPSKYYALVFLDIDAPHRELPKFRSLLNWMIINIPGNNVAKGDVKAEYIGAAPPKDSGLHRMVFLVYEQAQKLNDNSPVINSRSLNGRYNFKLSEFIIDNKLTAQPVAGNFFVSRFDNYVPVLQGQLGLSRR